MFQDTLFQLSFLLTSYSCPFLFSPNILFFLKKPKLTSRNLMLRRGVSSRPRVRTLFQEGHCESPHCTARQHATPPSQPCCLDTVLHQKWRRLCLALGKTSQEMCCLIGPTPPCLRFKHIQTRPAIVQPTLDWPFLRLACSNAIPGRVAPLLTDPSRWRSDTNVVSIASWAPCHRTNPSAITSILRPSSLLNSPKSRSRMNAFVVTLALASLHTCVANLSFPKPLSLHTLHDDGQMNRVGGHIGRCVRTGTKASEGVDTEVP